MHPALQLLLVVFYTGIFSLLVWRHPFFRIPPIPASWRLAAWVLKLAAGFVLFYIYSNHYQYRDTSDTFVYFDDAMLIRSLLQTDPGLFFNFMTGIGMSAAEAQPVFDQLHGWTSSYTYGLVHTSPAFIRLQVVVSFFSFGCYHVHTVFMCFMSFAGLTALYRTLHRWFANLHLAVFAACYLLPSVVFWSSGILKEAPFLFGMGFALYAFSKMLFVHLQWKYFAIFLLALTIMWYSKPFAMVAFMPAMTFVLLVRLSGSRWLVLKFLLLHAVVFLISLHAHHFFQGGDLLYVLQHKQQDFRNVAIEQHAGSIIDIPSPQSAGQFLYFYPRVLINVYLRPWITEGSQVLLKLAGMENLIYLMLLAAAIFFFRLPPRGQWPMLLFLLSVVLVLGALVGYTVPIMGATVRYRIAALPLLVTLCAAVIRWPLWGGSTGGKPPGG